MRYFANFINFHLHHPSNRAAFPLNVLLFGGGLLELLRNLNIVIVIQILNDLLSQLVHRLPDLIDPGLNSKKCVSAGRNVCSPVRQLPLLLLDKTQENQNTKLNLLGIKRVLPDQQHLNSCTYSEVWHLMKSGSLYPKLPDEM